MKGQMMQEELVVPVLLERARKVYPQQEIVSKLVDMSIHRYTFAEFYERVQKLASALQAAGAGPGDRIATFALNHYMHMELYFAVPLIGAVLHTLNVKLYPEQLVFIVNHAEDKFIFIDNCMVKGAAALQDKFEKLERFIIMDDKSPAADAELKNQIGYEEFLASGSGEVKPHTIQEGDAAALCYTSGTTGDPKGVLYSHRSLVLHSMAVCMVDTIGISMNEVILPVVPMFHVNAWGVPFACLLTGAKLVLPGAHMLGKALSDLLDEEKVSLALGVPTIWNALYQHLKKSGTQLPTVKKLIVGGSAVPRVMFENYKNDLDIDVVQAWGMTELSPIGSACNLSPEVQGLSTEEQLDYKTSIGLPAPFVDMRIYSDEGEELPWDGQSRGELQVKGPWVVGSYFNAGPEANANFYDGWFGTGDIVTIDERGYIRIVDRKKDLIKTRGEWLSSVEMESAVMEIATVLEAAVVGKPDEVRGEAVVLSIVPKEGQSVDKKEVTNHLKDRFAKWQVPKDSDILIVEELPKTSVGKIDKKKIRKNLLESAPAGA